MTSVSIITPSYNAERYIAHTIDSVRTQSFSDWELIVIDDGSSDGTCATVTTYLQRDSRIRLIQQHNNGVAVARNRGFAETDPSSEFVIFLDHDDVWEPDTLEQLIRLLMAHPYASAAYGLARFIDKNGHPFRLGEAESWGLQRRMFVGRKVIDLPHNAPLSFAALVYSNTIWTPGLVLIRRSILQKIDQFDHLAAPADDYDMWLRLTLHGELAFLCKVVLNYRLHDNNASHDNRKMADSMEYVWRKLLSLSGLDQQQQHLVIVRWALLQREIAGLRLHWACQHIAQRRLLEAVKQLGHAAQSYVQYINYDRSLTRPTWS